MFPISQWPLFKCLLEPWKESFSFSLHELWLSLAPGICWWILVHSVYARLVAQILTESVVVYLQLLVFLFLQSLTQKCKPLDFAEKLYTHKSITFLLLGFLFETRPFIFGSGYVTRLKRHIFGNTLQKHVARFQRSIWLDRVGQLSNCNSEQKLKTQM